MTTARGILQVGLQLAWLLWAARGDEPKSYVTLHELGKGVWAAVTVPRSGAGANSGFVVGSEGVAVVDAFQTTAAAEALLAAIRKTTARPGDALISLPTRDTRIPAASAPAEVPICA